MSDADLKYYILLEVIQGSKIESDLLSYSPISFSNLK